MQKQFQNVLGKNILLPAHSSYSSPSMELGHYEIPCSWTLTLIATSTLTNFICNFKLNLWLTELSPGLLSILIAQKAAKPKFRKNQADYDEVKTKLFWGCFVVIGVVVANIVVVVFFHIGCSYCQWEINWNPLKLLLLLLFLIFSLMLLLLLLLMLFFMLLFC